MPTVHAMSAEKSTCAVGTPGVHLRPNVVNIVSRPTHNTLRMMANIADSMLNVAVPPAHVVCARAHVHALTESVHVELLAYVLHERIHLRQ